MKICVWTQEIEKEKKISLKVSRKKATIKLRVLIKEHDRLFNLSCVNWKKKKMVSIDTQTYTMFEKHKGQRSKKLI